MKHRKTGPQGARHIIDHKPDLVKNQPFENMNPPEEHPEKQLLSKETIHEFRNPMAAIKCANEILTRRLEIKEAMGEQERELTRIIEKNIIKLDDLFRRMLEKKPGPDPVFSKTDVCMILDEAIHSASDRIFLKNITIKRNYAEHCFINADKSKLLTAFMNILLNSIEAINNDNGYVWMQVYPENSLMKVVIKDNGVGMDDETRKKIFDENFSRKPDGFGLGLVHVKEILSLHDAELSVDSAPNVGTSFIIRFRSFV